MSRKHPTKRKDSAKDRKLGRFPHSIMNQCISCKNVITAKEIPSHRCS